MLCETVWHWSLCDVPATTPMPHQPPRESVAGCIRAHAPAPAPSALWPACGCLGWRPKSPVAPCRPVWCRTCARRAPQWLTKELSCIRRDPDAQLLWRPGERTRARGGRGDQPRGPLHARGARLVWDAEHAVVSRVFQAWVRLAATCPCDLNSAARQQWALRRQRWQGVTIKARDERQVKEPRRRRRIAAFGRAMLHCVAACGARG